MPTRSAHRTQTRLVRHPSQEFTLHNPLNCLTEDDLEALNVLYPDCLGGATVPVCSKPAMNIGGIKMLLAFSVPMWFSLGVVLLFQFGTARYLRRLHRLAYSAEVTSGARRTPHESAQSRRLCMPGLSSRVCSHLPMHADGNGRSCTNQSSRRCHQSADPVCGIDGVQR